MLGVQAENGMDVIISLTPKHLSLSLGHSSTVCFRRPLFFFNFSTFSSRGQASSTFCCHTSVRLHCFLARMCAVHFRADLRSFGTTPAQYQPRPLHPGNASFLRSCYSRSSRWTFASLGRQGLSSMVLTVSTVSVASRCGWAALGRFGSSRP